MATYTYNPDGLRRSKHVLLTLEQRYVWSSDSMVYEYELLYPANGTVYVYGINLISARNSTGNNTLYLYSAHGDVVQLVDGNGTIIQTYNYDAFGVEYDVDEDDDNYFRYCGEYFDKETGTIYLRARHYNPATGRFTQQDGWEYLNAGDPLSLNLYAYCHSNPISYNDPSGHILGWIALGVVILLLSGCSADSSESEEPSEEQKDNETDNDLKGSPLDPAPMTTPYDSYEEALQAAFDFVYQSGSEDGWDVEYGASVYYYEGPFDKEGEGKYYIQTAVGDSGSVRLRTDFGEYGTLLAKVHSHPEGRYLSEPFIDKDWYNYVDMDMSYENYILDMTSEGLSIRYLPVDTQDNTKWNYYKDYNGTNGVPAIKGSDYDRRLRKVVKSYDW